MLVGPTDEEKLDEERSSNKVKTDIYGIPKTPNKFKKNVLKVAEEDRKKRAEE